MPARSVDNRPDPGRPAEPPERLARLQRDFAAHIRDPDRHAPPTDVEDRRMAIYRRLFFNNISSLLAGNFPVLRGLYNDERWRRLVREFYAEHRCRTPLFPEVAKEFLRHLQERKGREDDPTFLLELAHYEWVELALSLDTRELDEVATDPDGDLLAGQPVLSPLAWPLSYTYPVHLIGADYQPAEPPPAATHLLVYRNRQDHVKFMLLNDVTRLLLQRLQESPGLTGAEQLLGVAQDIRHPDPEQVVAAGTEVMEDLRQRDVLLGTRADAPDETRSE
jgi:hypothetical protein